jgi:hypothetical protein
MLQRLSGCHAVKEGGISTDPPRTALAMRDVESNQMARKFQILPGNAGISKAPVRSQIYFANVIDNFPQPSTFAAPNNL